MPWPGRSTARLRRRRAKSLGQRVGRSEAEINENREVGRKKDRFLGSDRVGIPARRHEARVIDDDGASPFLDEQFCCTICVCAISGAFFCEIVPAAELTKPGELGLLVELYTPITVFIYRYWLSKARCFFDRGLSY